jgi:(3,5-dihydroxyphenyl)acetyl-CoA 1,2-dioxygenase
MAIVTTESPGDLIAAGLPDDEVQHWRSAQPTFPAPDAATRDSLPGHAQAAARFYQLGEALLRRLPAKSQRGDQERVAAESVKETLRQVRTHFMRSFGEPVYADLTGGYRKFLRVEELVHQAAERYPGLTPMREAVLAERELLQKDKEGLEIDQGIFLSRVLSHPRAGAHLVHAMLRPRSEALERLEEFQHTGMVDLGTAYVQREGKAGYLYLRNTRFLNAEDDSTTDPLEIGVDLILLDPEIEVGVMRGAPVDHPKYSGRRVFNAGLNLTHLYHGKISYLFFITRDMGFVNKLYRGLSGPEFWPNELETTQEKPWIAAVESFAVGGGCQLLLVFDHVLADADGFFNLPARKEGIIPGASNLRLPRFVGDRLTRQAILFDRQFPADSTEGRLLCDEVIPKGEMDVALPRAVRALTTSGLVSAASNRKAIRVGQEPIDTFRQYMAVYAREQAYCHFSPQLIRNLEENWNAHNRRQ